jgi:hypothetical protein
MVFVRLGLGFVTGVTISMNAHEYVYMTIANCFVRPHWRFLRIKNGYYSKDHALDINLLDSYVRDAVGSFFLFWFLIGPVVYKAYIQKDGFGFDKPHEVEDTFATMLKKAFER